MNIQSDFILPSEKYVNSTVAIIIATFLDRNTVEEICTKSALVIATILHEKYQRKAKQSCYNVC